jgi:hypothetical protein
MKEVGVIWEVVVVTLDNGGIGLVLIRKESIMTVLRIAVEGGSRIGARGHG